MCELQTANNGSGWAFGSNIPMGGAGFQNQGRQLGGNVSFAQSLSGSQPATPLDLSYVLAVLLRLFTYRWLSLVKAQSPSTHNAPFVLISPGLARLFHAPGWKLRRRDDKAQAYKTQGRLYSRLRFRAQGVLHFCYQLIPSSPCANTMRDFSLAGSIFLTVDSGNSRRYQITRN